MRPIVQKSTVKEYPLATVSTSQLNILAIVDVDIPQMFPDVLVYPHYLCA